MQPSNKARAVMVRNAVLTLLAVGLAGGSYEWITKFTKIDPFAALRPRQLAGISEQVGIQLHDVKLRHYRGPKLVVKADVETIEVSQDRQLLDLRNITNGEYHTEHGIMKFDAAHGNWNAPSHIFQVFNGAHVLNKDIDLHADNAVFDQNRETLDIPGPTHGTFYDGQALSGHILYHVDTGDAAAHAIRWHGLLTKFQDAPPEAKRQAWDIKGDLGVSRKNDKEFFTGATATDGEIIVTSPNLVRERSSDVITCTGGVHYYSAKADIVADKAIIYRREKRALLIGNVTMFAKPKKDQDQKPKVEDLPVFQPKTPKEVVVKDTENPSKETVEMVRDSKSIREFPTLIHADQIEYWYTKGSRHAKIEGAPQARQDLSNGHWRYVWAHHALYDGEKDTLRLESSTSKTPDGLFKNSIGEYGDFFTFIFNTQEDNENYDGRLATVHLLDDDEIPKDDSKKSPTTPQTQPPNKPKS